MQYAEQLCYISESLQSTPILSKISNYRVNTNSSPRDFIFRRISTKFGGKVCILLFNNCLFCE